MRQHSPKILLEGIKFPEGPRWHGGRLWFSDIHAHRVMAVDLQGKSEVVVSLDDRPSGLGFLPDGSLLIVQMRTGEVVRHTKNGLESYAGLSAVMGYPNDMVVDALGRAYVGGYAQQPFAASSGLVDGIILLTPDRKIRVVAEKMSMTNGLVITPDGKKLIAAETSGHCLTTFDIVADGSLTNRRTFANFTEDMRPDGICLDEEGALWVALVGTPDYIRVKHGGTVLDRISLPDKRTAVACILGGKDRRQLFLVTARTQGQRLTSFQEDLGSTSNGWIETIEVDVPGAGWP